MPPTPTLRKAMTYVLVTLLTSWFLLGLFLGTGGNLKTGPGVIFMAIYLAFPLLAALYLRRSQAMPRPMVIVSLRPLNRWFFLAWLFPLGLGLLAIAVAAAFPGVVFSTDLDQFYQVLAREGDPTQVDKIREVLTKIGIHPFWVFLFHAPFAGATVNAFLVWPEEVGWRSYLLFLTRRMGFWRSGLFIGLMWGLWQTPLVVLGADNAGIPEALLVMASAILLSPLLCFVRIMSGNTLVSAVAHGTFNTATGLSLLLVHGGDSFMTGLNGLAGVVVLALANLLLLVLLRRPGLRATLATRLSGLFRPVVRPNRTPAPGPAGQE